MYLSSTESSIIYVSPWKSNSIKPSSKVCISVIASCLMSSIIVINLASSCTINGFVKVTLFSSESNSVILLASNPGCACLNIKVSIADNGFINKLLKYCPPISKVLPSAIICTPKELIWSSKASTPTSARVWSSINLPITVWSPSSFSNTTVPSFSLNIIPSWSPNLTLTDAFSYDNKLPICIFSVVSKSTLRSSASINLWISSSCSFASCLALEVSGKASANESFISSSAFSEVLAAVSPIVLFISSIISWIAAFSSSAVSPSKDSSSCLRFISFLLRLVPICSLLFPLSLAVCSVSFSTASIMSCSWLLTTSDFTFLPSCLDLDSFLGGTPTTFLIFLIDSSSVILDKRSAILCLYVFSFPKSVNLDIIWEAFKSEYLSLFLYCSVISTIALAMSAESILIFFNVSQLIKPLDKSNTSEANSFSLESVTSPM